MCESMTDSELIALSIEDNHHFWELIERYEQKLFRYIMRLGDFSLEEAEDLLQDIFIKVYVHLNEYDSSFAFSSWIYRIAHNSSVDYFRKKNIRSTISLDDEEYMWLTEGLRSDEDIHFELMEKDMKITIQQAISDLGRELSEVLLLRYIEEKSYDEISDILRIPPSTVGTLIYRAKKKLAGELLSFSHHL